MQLKYTSDPDGNDEPNTAAEDTVVTQWGPSMRPFRSYSADQRRKWLEEARDLMAELRASRRIDTFLSYGGLLGAVRSGALISHDWDVDICFVVAPPPTGVRQARDLIRFLRAQGYSVTAGTNGHFKVEREQFAVDFFACWRTGADFYMYFAVPGHPIADSIFPLATITVEGVEMPAPRDPVPLLTAIYGEHWRTPDPDFKYRLDAETWLPFLTFGVHRNREHWEAYYARSVNNTAWSSAPTQFAAFCAGEIAQGGRVLDFGCGNGRDGLFFGAVGFDVVLADYCDSALEHVRNHIVGITTSNELAVEQVDASDSASTDAFQIRYCGQFDAVYARFFLHAVDEATEMNFLMLAATVLKGGGRLMVEFRNNHDERADVGEYISENERSDGHYRRFVATRSFLRRARAAGFSADYVAEGKGFAKFGGEDPCVTRAILSLREEDHEEYRNDLSNAHRSFWHASAHVQRVGGELLSMAYLRGIDLVTSGTSTDLLAWPTKWAEYDAALLQLDFAAKTLRDAHDKG